MQQKEIINNNKKYWNENADLWFGTTALPTYGVKFVSEDDLHLLRMFPAKKYWKYVVAVVIHSNTSLTEMLLNYGESIYLTSN